MAKVAKRPRPSSPSEPVASLSNSASTPQPSKKPRKARGKHLAVPAAFPDYPEKSPYDAPADFSAEAQARLDDETEKDDEERRLEAMLFGVKYVPRGEKGKGGADVVDLTESGMGHLQDEDLFFVDDAAAGEGLGDLPPVDVEAAMEDIALELDSDVDDDLPLAQEAASGDFTGFDSADEDHSDADEPSTPPSPSSHPAQASAPSTSLSTRKKSAWTDPSDASLSISLLSSNRLHKLRDAAGEDVLSGREYELRLRRQFERLQPAPAWARPKKRADKTAGSDDEGDEDLESLLHGTGDLVQPPSHDPHTTSSRPSKLPAGELLVERLRDANHSSPSSGPISSVQFHPTLPVVLTASSADRRLQLFSISDSPSGSGSSPSSNPLLQSVHLPSLPLTTATFHPSGTSVFLAGPRPFYYTYDLQSGAISQSPRGLWGSTTSNSGGGGGGPTPADGERSFEISQFSPDGRMLAVAGRRGTVYLVDWRTGGVGGQVVGSVKMNSAVRAVRWVPEGSGAGAGGYGGQLMSVGDDAEVYIWDVGTRRCVRRWKDEGAFGPSALEVSRDGARVALGASTGIVNVYDGKALASGPGAMGMGNPVPVKTVMNLTTRITSLRFNHTSEILCLASKDRKDQLRMMHVPSNTVFSNWPTSGTPLGHVTSVDFSAGSEYVAIGNNRGKVLLYQLRHYIH